MSIAIDSRKAGRPGLVPSAGLGLVSRRARAFHDAQRHSRAVRFLRVLLPVAAACMLIGYVGLVALKSSLLPHFKLDDVVITADDLTMKNPTYFDTTKDGNYEVRAKEAIVSFGHKKDTPIKLIDVSGEMVKKSGEITKLKAKHGLFDNAKGELELFDGIEIDGSNGLMARLTRAMVYQKEGKIVSTEPVSANMPTGSVQAASMTMGTKTKLVHFRGSVTVRLVPQKGQTLAAGKDARQPVDITSEELDVDDTAKTAHFRGKVVAIQGDTMLQTPSLLVKYEGKATAALGMAEDQSAKDTSKATAKEGATRVTFMWARDGVEITAGNDRRITSDLADFDVTAETALFVGSVVATQEKNILKGARLAVDRKAGKSRLETPGGSIFATFVPPATTTTRPSKRPAPGEAVQSALMGGFKADRSAPMAVEATLLDVIDSANKAVFTGDVHARQGEMLLRTSQLTAFYSGKAGLLSDSTDSLATAGKGKGKERSEIVRMEARGDVIVTSGEQSATGKWADFDVKANTALLGGGVVVDKIAKDAADPTKRDIVMGDRLHMDLTTGIYRVEADPSGSKAGADAADGKVAPKGPATSSSPPTTAGATPEEKAKACLPGRTCVLVFPSQVKKKATDELKKRAHETVGQ